MNKIVLVAILLLLLGVCVVAFNGFDFSNSDWVEEPACATGFRYRSSDYCVVENKILAEDWTYVPEDYYD